MRYVLTIEADNPQELRQALASLMVPEPPVAIAADDVAIATPPSKQHHANGPVPEPEPVPEPAEAAAPAAAPRTRRKKETPAPEPKSQLAQQLEASAELEAQKQAGPAVGSHVPTLDRLKEVITLAARAAMKNEGPKTVLDLLPAFRDATGLDFVMNAEEKHRQALYDFATQAGVLV
jgi:hypothetical protein